MRALEGFGETFYFPASMSLVSDYHSPRTRSRAMSFHQSSVYAGTILGSWLGAWFAAQLGWRSGFYFSVLEPGSVAAGSGIEIVRRDPNRVTVRDIGQLYLGAKRDPELLERVGRLSALPQSWKAELRVRAQTSRR